MDIAQGTAGPRPARVARNKEQHSVVAQQVRELGAEAELFVTDVTHEPQVRRLESEVAAKFGKVQILINNAGINIRKPVTDFSLEEWRAVLDTNLTGVFLMCRSFVPLMKGQGYGRILNLTSIMSHVALGGRSAYCATKSGLLGFTRSLALELAAEKITVNGISPGPFESQRSSETEQLALYLCSEDAGF